jgi:hypothetical protein
LNSSAKCSHRSLPDWERVSRPGLMGELSSQPLLRGGLRGNSLVRLKGGSCNKQSINIALNTVWMMGRQPVATLQAQTCKTPSLLPTAHIDLTE